jgi:hypothetical protein
VILAAFPAFRSIPVSVPECHAAVTGNELPHAVAEQETGQDNRREQCQVAHGHGPFTCVTPSARSKMLHCIIFVARFSIFHRAALSRPHPVFH